MATISMVMAATSGVAWSSEWREPNFCMRLSHANDVHDKISKTRDESSGPLKPRKKCVSRRKKRFDVQ